jgi:hypothetical protein
LEQVLEVNLGSRMKSLYRRCFLIILLLPFAVCQAQPSLGLSNLAGFPDVVTQGTQYSLTGWIVNSGNTAFSGNVDMEMLVNGTDLLHITNNFNVQTPLQPGDSVYWMESNYTFPPGQFRYGNNDIIVWPTTPVIGNSDRDSIGKPVYFTNNAALRLADSGFEVFGEFALLEDKYTFTCVATNEGDKNAPDGVDLYVQMNWYGPVFVTHFENDIQPGETVEFEVEDFNILEAFRIGLGELTRNEPLVLKFFVLEHNLTMDPLNFKQVPVSKVLAINDIDGVSASVYPNPSSSEIYIHVDSGLELREIRLIDVAGKLVMESNTTNFLVIRDLPKGTYIFEAMLEGGTLIHKMIVKE